MENNQQSKTVLRQLRERTGLSALAFATSLDIERGYYYRLESGTSQPGLGKLRQITVQLARLLEEDPREILFQITFDPLYDGQASE